jgi:hypothetical protein
MIFILHYMKERYSRIITKVKHFRYLVEGTRLVDTPCSSCIKTQCTILAKTTIHFFDK